MTKLIRSLLPAAIIVVLAFITLSAHAAQGRAVSLKMLEKVLKDGTSKAAHTLCGVTRISGYVVDAKSKDIILVGKVDPSYPALQVDDFVIALRAANRLYARREGNVRYYTPPGCSIDPDPKTIRQFQQAKAGRGSSEADRRALAAEIEDIGRQPQTVRVLGVPFDTHFAKVMVDADYYMKRLSNGSVDLGIPGFVSMTSMRVEETREEFRTGVQSSQPSSLLNRFWFCPGECTYDEADGFVLLKDCRVKLLTEEEFLTARGEVRGLGRPSSYASRFAVGFTSHYQEIAEVRPIYRELESLFRFSAIANLMRDTNAASKSGNDLSYLLSGHKVNNVPVSRALPGQTRVTELVDERKTDYARSIRYVTLMSCGGVDMDVHPRKVSAGTTIHGGSGSGGSAVKVRTASIGKVVLASRKSSGAVYWDYSLPD